MLVEMRKNHPKARVLERVQALEVLGKGQKRQETAELLGTRKDILSDWTVKYNKYGVIGLFDKKNQGDRGK